MDETKRRLIECVIHYDPVCLNFEMVFPDVPAADIPRAAQIISEEAPRGSSALLRS